jgi:hypothetical protein
VGRASGSGFSPEARRQPAFTRQDLERSLAGRHQRITHVEASGASLDQALFRGPGGHCPNSAQFARKPDRRRCAPALTGRPAPRDCARLITPRDHP